MGNSFDYSGRAMSAFDKPYLDGQLLIAMPHMTDRRFARSVIFVCVHNREGAMGLVVNRLVDSLTYPELMQQIGLESVGKPDERRVHFGGPMETSRGFVLHSADCLEDGSLLVDDDVALTSTTDILQAIAAGDGPRHTLLALGYAGWGPGQLEGELQSNAWLSAPADTALLFDADLDTKWHRAIAKIGININMLSSEMGHA